MRIVAWEVFDDTLSLEDEQVVNDLVHEITVVAHHDDAAWEVLQVFLQDLQRLDVEVVGGFVEDKEIGVAHQHRTEIEFAAFASAELIHIVVLLFGREEKML